MGGRIDIKKVPKNGIIAKKFHFNGEGKCCVVEKNSDLYPYGSAAPAIPTTTKKLLEKGDGQGKTEVLIAAARNLFMCGWDSIRIYEVLKKQRGYKSLKDLQFAIVSAANSLIERNREMAAIAKSWRPGIRYQEKRKTDGIYTTQSFERSQKLIEYLRDNITSCKIGFAETTKYRLYIDKTDKDQKSSWLINDAMNRDHLTMPADEFIAHGKFINDHKYLSSIIEELFENGFDSVEIFGLLKKHAPKGEIDKLKGILLEAAIKIYEQNYK